MRLLIADDEEMIRSGLLSLDWKSIGIDEVYSASNGLEAADLIGSEKIDIVIFDIRMPGMTGIELAKYVKEKSLDTAVILLTGFSEFEYAREALRLGVYEYLLKPLRPKEILEAVQKVKLSLEQERYKIDLVRKYEDTPGIYDINSQLLNYFSDLSALTSEIMNEIALNFHEAISLGQLAEEYHFSENYLSKKIKKDAGVSFANILMAVRLTEAVNLLLKGEKIQKVCENTGFTDSKYFSQVFRKYINESPSEFKKSHEELNYGDIGFETVLKKIIGDEEKTNI
ncbi:response regulator [Lachnospiraceae bacterium C1.1]|nr:response regulator [Lachnospiraceae bacterium C1.1]